MQPDLLEKLTSFFKIKGSDSLRERRVLLVCMGLSLLIWFFVKMSQTYESRGILAMNYRPPIGRIFAEPPLRSMPFKFSGTGWELLAMGIFRQRPSLDFDISGELRQVISRTAISRKIEEELRLNLLELGQDNIPLSLDSLFSKKVKIELDTAIAYQNGYFIRDFITLTPDSVLVYGASKLLDKTIAVKTEPLHMNCPEKDFTKTLKIINPQPDLLTFSTTQTTVFLPVEEYTEKTITLPVLVMNSADSIRLVPASVELKCVVGVSQFTQVSASDFRVIADFSPEANLHGGTNIVPLTLERLPKGVRSVRFSPKVVEYLIVQ